MKILKNRGRCARCLPGALSLAALLGAAPSMAGASVLYNVDKLGPLVNHDDITVAAPTDRADLWWANRFDVQAGGEFITQIGLSFGNNMTVGTAISLLVYDDPNNDGNPADVTLLRQFDTTVLESDGSFDEPTFFGIPATQVTGTFFIAALLRDVPGNAGMTFHNEPGTSLGRSWLGASLTNPGSFDPANVLASSVDLAPATIDSLGVPGNWVLRAVGEPVPAPGAFALAALGGLTLARRKRGGHRGGRRV